MLYDPKPLGVVGGGAGSLRDEGRAAAADQTRKRRPSGQPDEEGDEPGAGDALEELALLEAAAVEAAMDSGSPQDEEDSQHLLGEMAWGFDEDEPEERRLGGCVAGAPAAEAADANEEPLGKKPRTEHRQVVIAASLEGLEARLRHGGEAPQFRVVRPGLLQHHCSTAEAVVSYWPGTLRWSVEGRHSEAVEDLLLQPLADG